MKTHFISNNQLHRTNLSGRGRANIRWWFAAIISLVLVGRAAAADLIESFSAWDTANGTAIPKTEVFEAGTTVTLRFSAHQPREWGPGAQMTATITDDEGRRVPLAVRQPDPYTGFFISGIAQNVDVTAEIERRYTLTVTARSGGPYGSVLSRSESRSITIRGRVLVYLDTDGLHQPIPEISHIQSGESFHLTVRLSCPLTSLGIRRDVIVRLTTTGRSDMLMDLPTTVRFRPNEMEHVFKVSTKGPASVSIELTSTVPADTQTWMAGSRIWVNLIAVPVIRSIDASGYDSCHGGQLRIRGSYFNTLAPWENVGVHIVDPSGTSRALPVLTTHIVTPEPGPVVSWEDMTLIVNVEETYGGGFGDYEVTVGQLGLVSNAVHIHIPALLPTVGELRVLDGSTGREAMLKANGALNYVDIHWSVKNVQRIEIWVSLANGTVDPAILRAGKIDDVPRPSGRLWCDAWSGVTRHHRLLNSSPAVAFTIKLFQTNDPHEAPFSERRVLVNVDPLVAAAERITVVGFSQIRFFNCDYPNHRPISIWYNRTDGSLWSGWQHFTDLVADVNDIGTCFAGVVAPAVLPLDTGYIYFISVLDASNPTCGFFSGSDDPDSQNCIIWSQSILGDAGGPEFEPLRRD